MSHMKNKNKRETAGPFRTVNQFGIFSTPRVISYKPATSKKSPTCHKRRDRMGRWADNEQLQIKENTKKGRTSAVTSAVTWSTVNPPPPLLSLQLAPSKDPSAARTTPWLQTLHHPTCVREQRAGGVQQRRSRMALTRTLARTCTSGKIKYDNPIAWCKMMIRSHGHILPSFSSSVRHLKRFIQAPIFARKKLICGANKTCQCHT